MGGAGNYIPRFWCSKKGNTDRYLSSDCDWRSSQYFDSQHTQHQGNRTCKFWQFCDARRSGNPHGCRCGVYATQVIIQEFDAEYVRFDTRKGDRNVEEDSRADTLWGHRRGKRRPSEIV